MTRASALLILEEKSACLIASPASFVGSGSFAMSISSVSTPFRLPSSSVTRRPTCKLMRPILVVPRMTGMNSVRIVSIERPILGRLLNHSALELYDLPLLFLRQPTLLRWFEVLRDIKLNHSRHSKPPTIPQPISSFP